MCTKIVLSVRNNFCTQHVLSRFELGIVMYFWKENVLLHTILHDMSLFFRSVAMNVEGTRSIIELAQKMQNLKALIHVSTAYAHCTQ